jgi:hypothetical protein
MTPPEPDDAGDPRPWEDPGAVRRDCEPHRGPALRLVGRLGLALGVASAALTGFWFLGLAYAPHDPTVTVLGVAALALAVGAWGFAGGVWWACSRDLALMGAGRMDPAGRAQTVAARLGAAAVLAVPLVGLVGGLLLVWGGG